MIIIGSDLVLNPNFHSTAGFKHKSGKNTNVERMMFEEQFIQEQMTIHIILIDTLHIIDWTTCLIKI